MDVDVCLRQLCVWLLILLLTVVTTEGEFSARVPPRKTWWAKRITPQLFVAGRLSETQIKYAAEDEFKSLVSVHVHPKFSVFGATNLPLTYQAKNIAEKLCGLQFEVLCPHEDNLGDDEVGCWRNISAVTRFDELYERLAKPVLLYSNTGYSATFVALAWLAARTAKGVPVDLSVSADDVYKRAAALGYDYSQADDLHDIVHTVSGGHDVSCRAKPDLTLPDWHKTYWWAKPVERNWYVAGQLQTDHLQLLHKFGAEVVINSRLGVSWKDPDTGEDFPTQEEVTLLNVNDECFTYCNGGRQSLQQLLENRIDPDKPSQYLGIENLQGDNYMSTNPWEFGDDVGYNETVERMFFKLIPVEYIHTPIGGALGYDKHMYEMYKATWMNAHTRGDVLAHCRTGHRAVISALLTLGQGLQKDMSWALEKASLMGYDITEDDDPDVWALFLYAFRNRKSMKTEL